MPTPHNRRGRWPDAAGATLGSFVALIDHLITAQSQLINAYLRIGSSVARGSRPATPTPTAVPPQPEDDQPATDLIAARAYQIFVQRGGEPGNPDDDWQRAEAELRADVTG
jgi:hypothetical protein